jgi:hypothetical protein
MEFDRASLRHCVATLAYRAAKTMRGAPPGFADYRPAPGANSPVQIVAHMGDLFDWALRMVLGELRWTTATPQPWDDECARFFAALRAFDDHLASDAPLAYDAARVFQGPVADALTHTGQLAMLRRLSGAPMKGESYNRADIAPGRVGPEQVPADPRYEFD